MAMHRRGWIENRFRGKGLRWTFPRQIILQELSRQSHHISVDELYFTIHREYPGVGLTTIYRTLEILHNMGLVQRYDFGDGKTRYELSQGPGTKHHHHLVCTKCGKIIDYSEMLAEEKYLTDKLQEKLAKKYDFNIRTHQIHFYGLCSQCKY